MIKLLHIDCMEYMATVPDKYYSLCIADPPYGIGKTWSKNRVGTKNFNGKYDNKNIPDKKYFIELKRISEHQIIWGANYYSQLWPCKNLIIWDKKCTWEKDNKSEIELAATTLTHRPSSIYYHDWAGARKGPETGITIIHPHQKPIALYKWLLVNYAKPTDKIIDTHLGSGSSAIAAYDFGINEFVGCEIDEEYYNAAKKRFEIHTQQKQIKFK